MEIREFAERALFEPRLKDKLASPDKLTDDRPGTPRRASAQPGRLPAFALSSDAARGAVPFPRHAELENERRRGEALHFFANHELMALEVMAMTLLKFPNAPANWRRAVAATMRDEQRHAQLYLDRMNELGVEFGDISLNDSFWRVGSQIASPMAYNAVVGLTLEQANLDFADHYRRLFRELSDEATAVILDEILADEIIHVRRGVTFIERWKTQEQSTWEAYRAALPSPITPAYAKGPGFLIDARRQAGLSEAFIDQLRVYSHSKARPPVVFYFNPDSDDMAHDLETIQTPLAHSEDVLLVRRRPQLEWLIRFQSAGFELPEYVVVDLDQGQISEQDLPREHSIGDLAPWRWDSAAIELLGPLSERLMGDPARQKIVEETAARKDLHSDVFATDQLAAFLNDLEHQPDWIYDHVAAIPPERSALNLSLSFRVQPEGRAQIVGCRRQLYDEHGHYRGTVLGRANAALSNDLIRFLHADGRSPNRVTALLEALARHLALAMAQAGHRGRAGLDACVIFDPAHPTGFRLNPLRKLIAGTTMGHIALALERRVAQHCIAVWLLVRRRDMESTHLEGFPQLVRALDDELPLESAPHKLLQGVVPTNDPETAEAVLGLLVVAPKLPVLRASLDKVGLRSAIDPHPQGGSSLHESIAPS